MPSHFPFEPVLSRYLHRCMSTIQIISHVDVKHEGSSPRTMTTDVEATADLADLQMSQLLSTPSRPSALPDQGKQFRF